jgi:hypothetical protein
MISSIAALSLATLIAAPVERGRVCPRLQDGLRTWIVRALRGKRSRYRRHVAGVLSSRIVAEARRFKLDPIVMGTIAWIESGYRPWVRGKYGGVGRRSNEVGVWQLIPGDTPVKAAARDVRGCKPSPRISRWRMRAWRFRHRGARCVYPDIGVRRTRIGYFARNELRDLHLGTFIAAYEMRLHITKAKQRYPRGYRAPRWRVYWRKWKRRNPSVNTTALDRFVHYNHGARFRYGNLYRLKLYRRYEKVRRGVCTRRNGRMAAR